MELPKLLIIGHGRHGKDVLADIFCKEYGFKAKSSSMAAAEILLYGQLKEKYVYKTFEECYADRHNHRAEWFDIITNYNTPDKSKLARVIMEENDIYVGMRNSDEIAACKENDIFDFVIWVHRPGVDLEGSDSFNITKEDADLIVVNDGNSENFREKLESKVDAFMGAYFAMKAFERELVYPENFKG